MERHMKRVRWLPIVGLAGWLAMISSAYGQVRPYIGYAYPAGGQQGTTFPVKLGGQGLDDVNSVLVSGTGVSAKIVAYFRKVGPQEIMLLREQLKELKRDTKTAPGMMDTMMSDPSAMMDSDKAKTDSKPTVMGALAAKESPMATLIGRIQKRITEYVQRPASVSISSLVFLDVTVDPDAEPGRRELRLATPRGVSNPLVFYVGQLPEVSRKPMLTSDFQVLGKEELAQRKRPDDEVEQRITLPCTLNGQVASGEVNQYRFEASKGQRLVIWTAARDLIPYVADAVPGWFQPVLTLYDAKGKELAYSDDFRFKPDPVIYFEVPDDGEYVLSMTDAIYRGREDFVYRITIGQLPRITSIFPLGARVGSPLAIQTKGWNLRASQLMSPAEDAGPGVYQIAVNKAGSVSNHVPFALDTLPEGLDKESNNDLEHAQRVKLPTIINGRVDRPDDWDVFQVDGRAGDTIVAEVTARRLDSPLDSMLKVTDATGKVLVFNDDYEDAGSGVNTHHADSYLMVTLPADGAYYVHLGDTARHGGEEYAYRLRISKPQPDFALRVVPSSVAMRGKSATAVSVFAIRKDGFTGDIKLSLKNPPDGFVSPPVVLSGKQIMTRLGIRTTLTSTPQPVTLTVEGVAMIGKRPVAREAVPAEDRMQAFLWRHLVPAEDLKALVFDPAYQPPAKRARAAIAAAAKTAPATPPAAATKTPAAGNAATPGKKFTKQQVASHLRQLKFLYEEGLLTDAFYDRKVAECEADQ
jgi:hypothetical protein